MGLTGAVLLHKLLVCVTDVDTLIRQAEGIDNEAICCCCSSHNMWCFGFLQHEQTGSQSTSNHIVSQETRSYPGEHRRNSQSKGKPRLWALRCLFGCIAYWLKGFAAATVGIRFSIRATRYGLWYDLKDSGFKGSLWVVKKTAHEREHYFGWNRKNYALL